MNVYVLAIQNIAHLLKIADSHVFDHIPLHFLVHYR